MLHLLKRSFFVLTGLFLLATTPTFAQVEPDSVRRAAWQQFQDTNGPQWEMRWHERTGVPRSIHGGVTKPFSGPPEAAARSFLAHHQDLFKMKSGLRNLKLVRVDTVRGVRHVRFQQTHRGVPVFEGQYLVHLRKDGRVDMANGHYYPDIEVRTSPAVSETAARSTATSDLGAEGELRGDVTHELMIYPRDDGSFRLAWKVIVPAHGGSWRYFIDAQDGRILEKLNLATSIVGTEEATVGKEAATSENGRASVVGTGDIIKDHPDLTPTPVSRNFYRLDGSGYLRGTYANVHNDVNSRAFSSTNSFHYSTSNTHFDEANVYYHIDTYRADYLDNLGFNSNIGGGQDLEAWVHDVTENPNNAGYYPGNEEVRFGANFDFAKEDKVIYHEFNHAVADVVNGGIDPTDDEEGAIGEGNADYFAGSYTGRTKILDYGALPFPERDMANPDIASYSGYQNHPDYPNVEEHVGGEFWSAILWDLRNASGISVAKADHLVYAGLSRVSSNPDFQEYRSAMVAEDNSAYGGQHECTVKRTFADRGVGSDPFTVWISSGPTLLDPGEEGTWSPSTNCAPGSVSYDWSYSPHGSPNSYNLGSGPSVSHSFYESVALSVEATSGGKTATGNWDILVSEGDCKLPPCPNSTASSDKQSRLSKRDRPTEFALRANRPNPVRTQTTIRYALPEASDVTLTVYDVMGRRVARLVQSAKAAGHHTAQFDASDVPSGMYIYRLQAGTFTKTKRLVIVK